MAPIQPRGRVRRGASAGRLCRRRRAARSNGFAAFGHGTCILDTGRTLCLYERRMLVSPLDKNLPVPLYHQLK